MDFYKILQSIMDEKNLNVSDVARLSGLSDSTIRSILSRKNKTVALEVAFKLSNGLDVTIEELNGEPKNNKKSNIQKEETEAFQNTSLSKKQIEFFNIFNQLAPEFQDHLIKTANDLYETQLKMKTKKTNF